MAQTKIGICNIALAMLGEDAIRDFNEKNKRARMCDVFFAVVRDELLAQFDWSFARKLAKLQPIDMDEAGLKSPDGMYAYQLPNDCLSPRDLHPMGSKQQWIVMERYFYCFRDPDTITDSDDGVFLYYTAAALDPSKFTPSFAMLLATGLAARMSPSISQDSDLTQRLEEKYRLTQLDAWEVDANASNIYREFDDDPKNDSFVNPDTFVSDNWSNS